MDLKLARPKPLRPFLKRGLIFLASTLGTVALLETLRRILQRTRRSHWFRPHFVEAAIKTLDEAGLRDRFETLAPAFRLTHAGAGRPRGASDMEIDAFMSLGLVCKVKAHIAEGWLDVYKLTDHGRRVHTELQNGKESALAGRAVRSTSS